MGQVDGLAFRGGEPSRGQEDVGRAKDCADTGVSVDPEILIIIDAHGSLHDQSGYRLTVGDVGVDSDKPGGPHGDPSGVGRIEDTDGAFLYQVDESLLAVVLRRMVAGKRGDGDVAAPHLPAHRDADNLRRGLSEFRRGGGEIRLRPLQPGVADIDDLGIKGSDRGLGIVMI